MSTARVRERRWNRGPTSFTGWARHSSRGRGARARVVGGRLALAAPGPRSRYTSLRAAPALAPARRRRGDRRKPSRAPPSPQAPRRGRPALPPLSREAGRPDRAARRSPGSASPTSWSRARTLRRYGSAPGATSARSCRARGTSSTSPGTGRHSRLHSHTSTRSRAGDTIRFTAPYATFTYVVTGHTIVAANDLSVLRPRTSDVLALQACHPRFFATQRYIVWARLRYAVTPRGRVAYAAPAGTLETTGRG